MKKYRILSMALAVIMLIPQMAVAISASSEYNYIDIGEEMLFENGDFSEAPNLNKANLGASFANAVDGYWHYSVFSGVSTNLVYDQVNKWLVVETDSTPGLAYAVPGIMDPGTYIFTFDLYAEEKIDNFRYQFFKDLGTSYENITGLTTFDKDVQGNSINQAGRWYTLSTTITLTEDTDLVFRVVPMDNSPGNYRVDNFSLSRPTDVLIETADMESVSDTAVSSVTTDAPADGVWTVGNLTYLNLDNSGEGIHVMRKSDNTYLPDMANAAYTFPVELDKGIYRFSFDVSASGSQTYTFNLADVTSDGWSSVVSKTVSNGTVTHEFEVTNDDSTFAFRIWPNANPPFTYSLDNLKIEKLNKTFDILNNDFGSADKITFNSTSYAAGVADSQWYLANGNGTGTFGYKNVSGNGVMAYEGATNTPSLGYVLCTLPKGNYTLSFDVYMVDNARRLKYSLFDITGQASGWGTRHIDDGFWDISANQWQTVSFNFSVSEIAGKRFTFRVYLDAVANDFYIDNLKIVATDYYPMQDIDTCDMTLPLIKQESNGTNWAGAPKGTWAVNGEATISAATHEGKNAIKYVTDARINVVYAPSINLSAGDYTLDAKLFIPGTGSTNVVFDVFNKNPFGRLTPGGIGVTVTVTKGQWFSVSIPFATTANTDTVWRAYIHDNCQIEPVIYVSDYSIKGHALRQEWNAVYTEDFSTAPTVINDKSVNITSSEAKANAGKWYSRDITPSIYVYNSAEKRLDITPNPNQIYASQNPSNALVNHTPLYYGFVNTFSKGDYAISFKLTANYAETYYVAAMNRAGDVLASNEIVAVAGTPINSDLTFTINSDTDVVFVVSGRNAKRCFSAYTVDNIELYKLTNPIIGVNSNGAIAKFESETEGDYYMIAGVQGANGYVNYSNGEKLNAGVYKLSGLFKTTASGANISATIGYTPLEEVFAIADEWTPITFNVVLKRDTTLKPRNGIRFTLDNNATFYFKDLELVFVEDLPEPALNSGIAMVLLKKMQGMMKPRVEKKLYNFMDNPDFDEAPVIREELLNYGWAGQKNGEWAVSINDSDKEGTGTVSYAEVKKEQALYVEASKTNPCISYRLNDKLDAGLYTLSIDILADGSGQKGFMVDVFDMQSGGAVRIGEGAAIVSRSVKAGEWSTMTVTFTATANADVIFRFWSGSALNYYVDNIQITKAGVFADGSVEEIVNNVEGLIKNGNFDAAPTIAAKALNYGWAGAKDGEWAYSVNTNEKADAKAELKYGDLNGEKCLQVLSNSNPSVSYAVNGKMAAGLYTLSVDVYVENAPASFLFDVFNTSGGTVVRTTAGAASVSANVKQDEWVTVNVPFTLTGESDVIFRFYPSKACSFYVDNVVIK